MDRPAEPEQPDLMYNGTAYRIHSEAVADLLARGVIVVAPSGDPRYELSVEHTVDELADVADVVTYAGARPQSRLRIIRRNAGFSTGRAGLAPRMDYISIEDEPSD